VSDCKPWPVGTKVAWYDHYDTTAVRVATVEKVHKTGHMVIEGRRFRLSGDDCAREAGDGWSKASVRLLDDERKTEITNAKKLRAARRVGAWLSKATLSEIPEDALKSMFAAMKASEKTTEVAES